MSGGTVGLASSAFAFAASVLVDSTGADMNEPQPAHASATNPLAARIALECINRFFGRFKTNRLVVSKISAVSAKPTGPPEFLLGAPRNFLRLQTIAAAFRRLQTFRCAGPTQRVGE